MQIESYDALIYDLEIRKCIGGMGLQEPGYQYCNGWGDYAGMGISVLVAYDCASHQSFVYLKDNLDDFRELAARREYLIGYNSLSFDDKVLEASGVHVKTTYDLYNEVKLASGIKPGRRISGYKLDQVCAANGLPCKTGDGADAPKLWQDRRVGELINYCISDVYVTKELFFKAMRGDIVDPVSGMNIRLRTLFEGKHNGPQKALEF